MTSSPPHEGPRLAELTRGQIAQIVWAVFPTPLIEPPFPSPIIADPTFLPPESTPDAAWHLWAHSMFSLRSYRSSDGIRWDRGKAVVRSGLRAQILSPDRSAGLSQSASPDSRYRLTYEKSRFFVPHIRPWRSWIETRTGSDLVTWSDPSVLLRPSLAWHRSGRVGESVSNPFLLRFGDRWRLYFSAGLTMVPDCGFPEPTHVGVAEAETPDGPFTVLPDPILSPGDGPANLAAGALKVMRAADGWVGFQNAITYDGEHSASAIWVLGSDDGLNWSVLADRPALGPGGPRWRSTHVYALDVRDTSVGPRMYFNARNGYHWTRGRERIGLATPATSAAVND